MSGALRPTLLITLLVLSRRKVGVLCAGQRNEHLEEETNAILMKIPKMKAPNNQWLLKIPWDLSQMATLARVPDLRLTA